MQRFTKSKKKSWFYSPIITVVLLIMVTIGIIASVKAYGKQEEAVSLRNNTIRENDQLVQKERELSEKLNDISTERGMETEVRNRYRVVKPGEQLVIVVDNRTDIPEIIQEKTFWEKLRLFIGL